MQVSGLLFMSRAKPTLTRTPDGAALLCILAVHRISQRQTEPWRLTWLGTDAEAFFTRQRDALQPGCPLRVQAHQLRAHAVAGFAEIHAACSRIEVLPHDQPAT